MKFSVGYRIYENDDFMLEIIKRKDKISEVYFSWGDFPNGRNNQLRNADLTQWEAQQKQIEDLKLLADNGIPLNMLFNGNCYGKDSQSKRFFEKIGTAVDFIQSNYLLKGVTTTSILIAKFIKSNFSDIDVRASVNMSIGTEEGIDYVSEYFDSFYLKRELNRDLDAVKKIKEHCDKLGKGLYGLANSGCLNNCSAHTFHDNLVAHESEIEKMDNGYAFEGVCKQYLKKPENSDALFTRTNFIRPEDVHLYEGLFDGLKLATRVNQNPRQILKAYIDNGRYVGNILQLLEPNHSELIYPYVVENSNINCEMKENELCYCGELTAVSGCSFLE